VPQHEDALQHVSPSIIPAKPATMPGANTSGMFSGWSPVTTNAPATGAAEHRRGVSRCAW
jgi:hypothetical protein